MPWNEKKQLRPEAARLAGCHHWFWHARGRLRPETAPRQPWPQRGQLQLEAILCFCAFLAILALFASALNQASGQAEQAGSLLAAKSNAESCCIAADSVYATGLSGSLAGSWNCHSSGSTAEGKDGANSKSASCIARRITVEQAGNKTVLEVSLDGHYR